MLPETNRGNQSPEYQTTLVDGKTFVLVPMNQYEHLVRTNRGMRRRIAGRKAHMQSLENLLTKTRMQVLREQQHNRDLMEIITTIENLSGSKIKATHTPRSWWKRFVQRQRDLSSLERSRADV